jgi:hypothetical protein
MFAAECAEQCNPQVFGGICLTSTKSCNPDFTVIDGDAHALENGLALRRLTCEERGSKQVVRFSPAHRLL